MFNKMIKKAVDSLAKVLYHKCEEKKYPTRGQAMKANVFEVAKYILRKVGNITAMKLEKLVYYCQAWNLAWEEKPLFYDKIEAWEKGPVCPGLYQWHAGRFMVDVDPVLEAKCLGQLSKEDKENIDRVLETYAKLTAYELSALTHMEDPWIKARASEKPNEEITYSMMHEYYSSLN